MNAISINHSSMNTNMHTEGSEVVKIERKHGKNWAEITRFDQMCDVILFASQSGEYSKSYSSLIPCQNHVKLCPHKMQSKIELSV